MLHVLLFEFVVSKRHNIKAHRIQHAHHLPTFKLPAQAGRSQKVSREAKAHPLLSVVMA